MFQRWNYTIPRTVRELQHCIFFIKFICDYTIPRTVRELQLLRECRVQIGIIPYQELLGNYNRIKETSQGFKIIPYQELLGNYNDLPQNLQFGIIIPYQELLGNYNSIPALVNWRRIIPYQELLGNYNLHGEELNAESIIPYQELLGNYNRNAAMRARTALYHTRNCRASTKEAKLLQHTPFSKTKCVPFSALSLYFLRAHSQNGHTALYRLKFPKQ